MARLKTFRAHLGFFDTVVAAPSQKAALEAWGSRQNLFQNGTASVATDEDAIKAALAKPGVVLKRLAGSTDPFVEQPALPKVSGKRREPAKKPQTAKPKRQPDRSKLDAAKRALDALKQERERIKSEFASRERTLHEEKAGRERDFDRREAELRRDVEREQKALRSLR